MKWQFTAMFVSMAVLTAACSFKSKPGGGGAGGEGGDTTTTGTTTGAGGGMGGASGGAVAACDNTGDCQKCGKCAQSLGGPCYQVAADFQKLPNAMTFYQCIGPCQNKPTQGEQQSCAQACCSANMPECQAYQAFVQCTVCTACYSDCTGAAKGCPAP